MTSPDSLGVEEQEAQREIAKGYLNTLQIVDQKVFEILPLVLRRRDKPDRFQAGIYAVKTNNAEQLDNLHKMFAFLTKQHASSGRTLHDLGNFAVAINSVLNIYHDAQDENTTPENLEEALLYWDRIEVSLEDMLLRLVDKDKIPENYVRPIDLGVWNKVVDFFNDKEIKKIKDYSNDEKSPYYRSAERHFEVDVDWVGLVESLKGKQVKANDGLVCNFILNAFRNALGNRIQSESGSPTKVKLSIKIEGDKMVVRIDDDGKGMDQKHLAPKGSGESIFDLGVSGTGSTGMGLENFNKRFASCGGALFVVSRREGATRNDSPASYQIGGSEEELKQIEFNHLDHGTVFELQLKIENI